MWRMISGLLTFRQSNSVTLLVFGDVSGLTFLVGENAGELARFLKAPGRSKLKGNLYFNDLNLKTFPPEFFAPTLDAKGFEERLDVSLERAKTFVFIDFSYLSKEKVWPLIESLKAKEHSVPILVYAPACYASSLSLLFTEIPPVKAEEEIKPEEAKDLSYDLFVGDTFFHKDKTYGDIYPMAKEAEPEPKPEAVNEGEIVVLASKLPEDEAEETNDIKIEEEKPLKKDTKVRRFFRKVCAPFRLFFSKGSDYIFMAIFLLLSFFLTVLLFSTKVEERSKLPFLCIGLSFIFDLFSIVPAVFIVHDYKSPFCRRAILAYIVETGLCLLFAAISLTMYLSNETEKRNMLFAIGFALTPIVLAIASYCMVLWLKKDRTKKKKKENTRVS